MKQILVYGDSLSWGIVPESRARFPFGKRWPGVLEGTLLDSGISVRVLEDCLNGRRTMWDDPDKPGRNGLAGIGQRVEAGSPLALVIVMLGTNDFQSAYVTDAKQSAHGLKALVEAIRAAPIEPDMAIPPVMLVAPPGTTEGKGTMAPKFDGAKERARGFSAAVEAVAEECGCHFFDAGTATSASDADGIHFDEEQHRALGVALSGEVRSILD